MKVKHAILAISGLLPFGVGIVLNNMMMGTWFYAVNLTAMNLISWGMLALWAVAGFIAAKFFKRKWEILVCQNAAGAVMLVALLISVSAGQIGFISTYTQFFFLPFIRTAAILRLPMLIPHWSAMFAAPFVLMVLASLLGAVLGRKHFNGGRG